MGSKRNLSGKLGNRGAAADAGDVRSPVPVGYAQLLQEIKDRIQQSQTRAIFSVNAEMIRLYWDIGRMIDDRQRAGGLGGRRYPAARPRTSQ